MNIQDTKKKNKNQRNQDNEGKAVVFTTCYASFVFSAQGKIQEEKRFKQHEIEENEKLLTQGKILHIEKQLAQEYNAKILGVRDQEEVQKAKEKDAVEVFFGAHTFHVISEALRKDLNHYMQNNQVLTRHGIKVGAREDLFLSQAVHALQENDKIINMLAKRIRESYGYFLPEFEAKVHDNEEFFEAIVTKDKQALLKYLKISEKESMGAEMGKSIHKEDVKMMQLLAQEVLNHFDLREAQEKYLEKVMQRIAPNILALAGATIGAKLIAKAGSLKKLSEFPASTVQMLGAEKALFRHLRNKKKYLPPKYGVLHEHPLVARRSKKKDKVKAARVLADKISIAAKVDYFKGKFVGDMLQKQVEKKLR
jgi:nucleolar protein 56